MSSHVSLTCAFVLIGGPHAAHGAKIGKMEVASARAALYLGCIPANTSTT